MLLRLKAWCAIGCWLQSSSPISEPNRKMQPKIFFRKSNPSFCIFVVKSEDKYALACFFCLWLRGQGDGEIDAKCVLSIAIPTVQWCCAVTTDDAHPSRSNWSLPRFGMPECDSDALVAVSKTFSGLPGIIKPTPGTLKRDVPIWCKVGRLISHNALSWCDNEKWPQPATCQYQGRGCTDAPWFLFNPVFFKMIALVTFPLPVCQLDIAIFPLSSLSCSVSFILKCHFTHGWL